MFQKILLAFAAIANFIPCIAQDMGTYHELVDQAEWLYNEKSFQSSAWTYKAAFDKLGGKAESGDRYKAACSYALSGNADTAFYHLFRLAKDSKFDNYDELTTETDLETIHVDKRWNELLSIVQSNKQKAEASLNKELAKTLSDIYGLDQDGRSDLKSFGKKYGNDSPEMKAAWQRIAYNDSMNQVTVTRILDEQGWLGAEVVGKKGNMAFFLVIQHADLTIQEKYLPMMRVAVKEGKAHASNLALLEDRVLLRQGKRQIYGSQVFIDGETGKFFVQPLDDPDHVDERRASVGLGPLSEYLALWDLKWDVEEYKKELPKIEARMRELEKR